jgi:hypothetical protein
MLTRSLIRTYRQLCYRSTQAPKLHYFAKQRTIVHFSSITNSVDSQSKIQKPKIELHTVEIPKEGTYEKVRKELARHLSVASQFRNGLLMAGTFLVASGSILWLFKNQVKDKLVVQTSDITKRSLEDDHVQQQVNHLSQDVVSRILADPEIFKQVLTLLKNLSHDPQVASDVCFLLSQAINQKEFKHDLQVLFTNLMKDPETQSQINASAKLIVDDLLKDEALRTDLINYLKGILNDSQIHQSMSTATWQSLKRVLTPRWFIVDVEEKKPESSRN